MKKTQILSIIRSMLIALAIFLTTVFVGLVTGRLLVLLGISENEIDRISGMFEAITGAIAVGLVLFELKQGESESKRETDIQESRFIFEYNQAFIQDPNMTAVEHLLESQTFYDGRSKMINDENRQDFINYLVYHEGMAPLILRKILMIEHIDDLFNYRFFLAMNNPELQEDQLKAFPEYYKGCFKLYKIWKAYRLSNHEAIINPQHSIDLWEDFEKYAKLPEEWQKIVDSYDKKR